jgi:hypothetical protein
MYILKADEEFNEEESKTVEFKAHDRIGFSQMTPREIDGHLFQPASRTLCAFLNINKVCHLYLGIQDNGTVKGHYMFKAQMDHFKQALNLLMEEEFDPPVDRYRYAVNFIEVEAAEGATVYPSHSGLTIKQEHQLLKLPDVCWCEKEISQHKRSKKYPPLYVIHVQINKWDPNRDSKEFKVWPYYTSEEGRCFTRYNASNHEVTPDQVIEETKNDVKQLYKAQL